MEKRRSDKEITDTILKVAESDANIIAVILTGSRANPNAKQDLLQDYDIVYLVEKVEPLVSDKTWLDAFGKKLIMQEPDKMNSNWETSKDLYTFLMLFEDGNRIDLKLLSKNKLHVLDNESLKILLLDKDNSIESFEPPSDKSYLPKPPTEQEFLNCCNEFYWVATYVAKGIIRKELTYTHYMFYIIRDELIKLMAWNAGIKTDYKINFGMCGKYLEQYIEPELWQRFEKTYACGSYNIMSQSLLEMIDIFNDISLYVSNNMGFTYKKDEFKNVSGYLNKIINN